MGHRFKLVLPLLVLPSLALPSLILLEGCVMLPHSSFHWYFLFDHSSKRGKVTLSREVQNAQGLTSRPSPPSYEETNTGENITFSITIYLSTLM